MNLYYINPGNSSVMEAQIISLLNYYYKIDYFNKIYLFQGFRNLSEKKIIEKKLLNFNIPVIWFRLFPKYPLLNILNKISLRKKINSYINEKSIVIHIRGEYLANQLKSSKIRNNKILLIPDIRGVTIEEFNKYYDKNKTLLKLKSYNVKTAFKRIAKRYNITVVSSQLKEYLIHNYKFQPNQIYIHYNIASNTFKFNPKYREEIRDNFDYSVNDIVVIMSSGGGAAWQKDNEVADILISRGYKILNLSPHNIIKENIINLYVPYKEVPKYLSAADIGILWRDINIVNFVASPSKFSEFMLSGLFVIHNGSINLVSSFIENNKTGLITKDISELRKIKITKSFLTINSRIRRSNIGYNTFSVDIIGKSYLKMYKELISN